MATTTIDGQAAITDIKVDRGERFSFDVTIVDGDGSAIDITNHDVELLVQDEVGGTEIVKITNGVGDHQAPSSGVSRFILTSAITDDADAAAGAEWVYSIHWKDNGSPANEDIAARGQISVNAVPFGTIA